MFDKDIEVPKLLEQLEALEGRLPENHIAIPEIKLKIKSLRSGYNGEKAINYYLSQLPQDKFRIFHDLRLRCGKGFFQIDAFLLSQKMKLILEGKNHSGTLHIDRNQMVQEYNGNREIYENPISQAERHKILMNYFLKQYQIPHFPSDCYVIFCKPSAEIILPTEYMEGYERIQRVGNLLNIIQASEKRFNRKLVNGATIDNISTLLLQSHTPKDYDVLKMFSIDNGDIVTGVQCPSCLRLPMTYHRMYWICPFCQFVSKDAHLKAINDYFLIFNTPITNSEVRTFLHLPNVRIASYLLSLVDLPHEGVTKGRIYLQTSPQSTNYVFPDKTNTIKNNLSRGKTVEKNNRVDH
ncbi:nuclease-related domain-containing protein [Neobacillus sp. OS1-32]|uniref:nuclease-related domain-containing protein n=1 Tax=Neobacillus sp. OS1-32 TaxID=3070682 RepID=UPI0027E0841A|nr:nuclease-related domain-containing protein [Neobacillus sp. OS1-32]WML28686.1 nuclease-related domain-containing protein [Neobacillus sp. OS1-32]